MPVAQKRRAVEVYLPAPVGGWNARDGLPDMPEDDAVILTNLFPSTSEVILRKGYTEHLTGLAAPIETLMTYAGSTSQKMFAISGSAVYDATTPGAVGAAVLSGLTNARWQYLNITTPGGSYLMMVNGADAPVSYDGTTWANPAITGVTTTTLSNINLHQNRLWFTQNATLKAWYLPTGSIAGAATAFDLSSIAQMGGYLVAMATWTIDAGFGVDDLAVFITSEGEVIIYKGTDPASITTWALVGVFRIGSPIGQRCWVKYAGDLLVITFDGVVPMSGALQSSRTNPRVLVTDKIQTAMSDAVAAYNGNFGWEMILFPSGNQLYLNVPIETGDLQQQFVMNTISKSWCYYTGWNANCWTLFNDEPYFGGPTYVGHAWNTLSDNGNNINGDALQAFNYFGARGQLKRWTMARPIFRSNGTPALQINMDIDFDTSDTTAPLNFSPVNYAAWDIATWDNGIWGGGLNVLKNWQGVNGLGYCAGASLITASNGIEVTWVSTDFVMEQGQVL